MTCVHEKVGHRMRDFREKKSSTNGCINKTEIWCTLLMFSTQRDEECNVQRAMRNSSGASTSMTKGPVAGGSNDPDDNAKISFDGIEDVAVEVACGATTVGTDKGNTWCIDGGTTGHCVDPEKLSNVRRALTNCQSRIIL